MLWTLSEPVLAVQLGKVRRPTGNLSNEMVPHGVYPCAGDDQWVGLAVQTDAEWRRLCGLAPGLADRARLDLSERRAERAAIDEALSGWTRGQSASTIARVLIDAQIAAAPVACTRDLIEDPHLQARGFWDAEGEGVLPGLPWRASFPRATGDAPQLGADTDSVLREILQMPAEEIAHLREIGAIA
jgi:crotonobetainyl-CoA:carnitine CoA-transferase CaiB-like acyl-CoA transferase